MSNNSVFSVKKVVEELYEVFEDTDITQIEYQYFKTEMQGLLQQSDAVETLLQHIIEHIKLQQDKNLRKSRQAVNMALKNLKQHPEFPHMGCLQIERQKWNFNPGQILLLVSPIDLSSQFYRHVVYDLAINQQLHIINFITQPKFQKIVGDMVNKSNKKFDQQINFNADIVKLKQSHCINHFHYTFNRNDFEHHLKYLLKKYPSQVVYIDESELLMLSLENNNKNPLQELGEYLLRIANNLNITIILKLEIKEYDQETTSDKLPYTIGNIINYAEHCLYFKIDDSYNFKGDYDRFHLFSLKQYPIEKQTLFFNEESNLYEFPDLMD